MIRAVFLDLNGVLIQSDFLSARFERAFGVSQDVFLPTLKHILSLVRLPNAPGIISLWEPYFKVWGLTLSGEEFLNFWFSGESLQHDILSYIQELSTSGVSVIIISNNFRERTLYYRLHFPEIFKAVRKTYFSWETGFVKPSADALQLALHELHLVPQDALYFDDTENNIILARSIGIDGQRWLDVETARQYIDFKLKQ